LLGPNGAGKTTVVRSVAAACARTARSLRISRPDPFADEARSGAAWVPQEIALYPLLSRGRTSDVRPLPGARGGALVGGIRTSLDWIGLADRADEKTDRLSGGMKRA
jgi:ABC-2 type transport system ATP-binding protein